MRVLPGRHLFAAALGAGAIALIAAGCGGSSSTTSTGGSATTTGAAASAGTAVKATLTEFKIALATSPTTPGTYTFDAVNAGTVVHALEIDGPGVSAMHTGDIQPGQSANLTVTLQNGTYDVFCPVANHKQLGMSVQLTVGGSGSAAGSATTSGSASGASSGSGSATTSGSGSATTSGSGSGATTPPATTPPTTAPKSGGAGF